MTAERTPGLWTADQVRDFSGEHICFIYGVETHDIARTRGADPALVQANAEYIVRAVNAHEALVEAVQSALTLLAEQDVEDTWDGSDGTVTAALRDALAAATEAGL